MRIRSVFDHREYPLPIPLPDYREREAGAWITCAFLLIFALAAAPTSVPADVDPALWQRMLDIDSRSAQIQNLVADFQQEKHTALLKRPLLSKGKVYATTNVMRWDTAEPEPTVMRIDESSAAIYYPKEKLEEVYPVTGQLGSLAASPLPRLDRLKQHFTFAADPEAKTDEKQLALVLTPVDPSLREHVDRVRVLLDAERGLMLRVEVLDADGDRTSIVFSDVRTNVGLKDPSLPIDLPPGVKVSRPLENLGTPPQRK